MEDFDREVVLGMAAQAPDGIVIIDHEGLICYWNRGAERIFGYSAAEVAGRNLDVIIPENRQRHWDGFVAAMAAGSRSAGTMTSCPFPR
jgi:PAS domain S-box-containing protein